MLFQAFDKYVEKVDESYGNILKQNRLLRCLVYPSMVMVHCFMVNPPMLSWSSASDISPQWLLSHFSPPVSAALAALLDRLVGLIHGPALCPAPGPRPLARWVLSLQPLFTAQIWACRYVCPCP